MVKCGHCPACQQEHANLRRNRIMSTMKDGDCSLFCTLTYKNDCVPYILRSDIVQAIKLFKNFDDVQFILNIYRDTDFYFAYDRSRKHNLLYSRKINRPIDSVVLTNKDSKYLSIYGLKDLNKKLGCIGVLYYKDVQNFMKRLRQNLKRNYNYNEDLFFYACSEYGSQSLRPHFHLLIFTTYASSSKVVSAFNAAWPFADTSVNFNAIEYARDASSYVSSYVNRGSDFPVLFEKASFRPKSSYSSSVGMGNSNFLLPQILKNLRKGIVTYSRSVNVNGIQQNIDFLLPKYVIRRYFPKFKGFGRLTTNEASFVLQCPQRLALFARYLDYSLDDLRLYKTSLNNAFSKFCFLLNLDSSREVFNRTYFAQSYINCYKARYSYILKEWLNNKDNVPTLLLYDNWAECILHPEKFSLFTRNRIFSYFNEFKNFGDYVNPNTFPHYKALNDYYSQLFYKKQKIKKVTNIVLSKSYNV